MTYTTTYKSGDLPNDIIKDINQVLSDIVTLKKDTLWQNYQEYDFEKNLYISVQYDEEGRLELLSSVFTRDFYPLNTYRIFNKLARNPYKRLGAAKTNNGKHPSHVMLDQQINIVENELNANFYFISRQQENNRWMNYYIEQFNQSYNKDLIVTRDRYWVCPNFACADDCTQLLIYPESKNIPFKLYS